jgi:hypothetical protein
VLSGIAQVRTIGATPRTPGICRNPRQYAQFAHWSDLASAMLLVRLMLNPVRPLAVLATTLFAAPAFAQPGTAPDPLASDLPVNAGTVVIVTPQPPITVQGPGQQGPGQQAPRASAAPQNEPWSNVSHINGQLVKVGEHSDYLYDTGKTTNIASNPVGWMFGFYGVSVSHAVHANVAIRGDVNWFSFAHKAGHELGVSFPIYFRRVFQGPFLEPGVIARNVHDDCYGCDGSSDEHVGPEVLFGWQWSFDSGLNVAMAFGAMRNLHSHSSSSEDAEPAGYFRIGYLF